MYVCNTFSLTLIIALGSANSQNAEYLSIEVRDLFIVPSGTLPRKKIIN